MLNFNFLQFGEILGILPNTIAASYESNLYRQYYLILPAIEIPKSFKFNNHQSVGNFISFLVGPKFSNLVVCIDFPSKDVDSHIANIWFVDIYVNGEKDVISAMGWLNSNYDHLWLVYEKVNISNPSKENRIVVEVRCERRNISLNRMRIYVECICCPQKPNISPTSSMDQCAFNNGEEDLGRFGIRRRLRRRNLQPTHARRPKKHYLSHFGWL